MRQIITGVFMAMAVIFAGAASVSAAPVNTGSSQMSVASSSVLQNVSYCSELRRSCQMKRELGEQGQGNCRRYQAECGL